MFNKPQFTYSVCMALLIMELRAVDQQASDMLRLNLAVLLSAKGFKLTGVCVSGKGSIAVFI